MAPELRSVTNFPLRKVAFRRSWKITAVPMGKLLLAVTVRTLALTCTFVTFFGSDVEVGRSAPTDPPLVSILVSVPCKGNCDESSLVTHHRSGRRSDVAAATVLVPVHYVLHGRGGVGRPTGRRHVIWSISIETTVGGRADARGPSHPKQNEIHLLRSRLCRKPLRVECVRSGPVVRVGPAKSILLTYSGANGTTCSRAGGSGFNRSPLDRDHDSFHGWLT